MGDIDFVRFLPFIIPFALIQLGCAASALVHIFKSKTFKMGNRLVWALICIFTGILGALCYFVLGRSEGDGEG